MTSLGNWQNKPVAVGHYNGDDDNNNQVEQFENGIWKLKTPFPYVDSYLYHYSMASFDSEF